MFDNPQIRPQVMSEQQRGQFLIKAKANRLAFDVAQHLSRGETAREWTTSG